MVKDPPRGGTVTLPPNGTGWRRPCRRSKVLPKARRKLPLRKPWLKGAVRRGARGVLGNRFAVGTSLDCVRKWLEFVICNVGPPTTSSGENPRSVRSSDMSYTVSLSSGPRSATSKFVAATAYSPPPEGAVLGGDEVVRTGRLQRVVSPRSISSMPFRRSSKEGGHSHVNRGSDRLLIGCR